MPEEKTKTIWSELESNPGPLAPQATALTTRPCLLGPQTGLVNGECRARLCEACLLRLGSGSKIQLAPSLGSSSDFKKTIKPTTNVFIANRFEFRAKNHFSIFLSLYKKIVPEAKLL